MRSINDYNINNNNNKKKGVIDNTIREEENIIKHFTV